MTYEYECKSCGHQWEAEQEINEPAIRECPECHEEEAKRIVCGSGAFILNGPRWAKDAYS